MEGIGREDEHALHGTIVVKVVNKAAMEFDGGDRPERRTYTTWHCPCQIHVNRAVMIREMGGLSLEYHLRSSSLRGSPCSLVLGLGVPWVCGAGCRVLGFVGLGVGLCPLCLEALMGVWGGCWIDDCCLTRCKVLDC